MSDAHTELPAFTPAMARELRESVSLGQNEMADRVLLGSGVRWSEYERGIATPSRQTWALALIVAGQHPLYGPRAPAAPSVSPGR